MRRKLCRLVLTYGDAVLSETCTLFPREKHEGGGGDHGIFSDALLSGGRGSALGTGVHPIFG